MKILGKSVVAAAFLVPGLALAQANIGDNLGTNEADIRAALEAKGFVIEEFEMDDKEIEVEASLDGMPYEIEVSNETGMVIEVALDDDDDDSDDDDDKSDEG